MRALLWVVIVAAAGWSGWWWVASDGARRGAEAWFAQVHGTHRGIAVAGFPNRIDLTVTEPGLARDGWGWRAPFVQSFALSYKPWHLIAAFAPSQRIETPAGPVDLASQKLQASLVLVPGGDLTLDRFQLAGEGLRLSGVLDLAVGTLSLATRRGEGTAHDLGLSLRDIAPPAALMAALPEGLLPATVPEIRADAALAFSAPLDRHAGATRPELTAVTLRELRADWGPIRLRLSGDLTPDAAGLAEGRLTLRLEGARELLELAQAAGLVTPDTRPAWENVLATLAPPGQPVELPLKLSGGVIALGPMVLGPAPRLQGGRAPRG